MTSMDWADMGSLGMRLVLAFVIGVLLAVNPVSRALNRGYTHSRRTVYAVALMCVASAVVIMIIGDSLARAFGVVGLGSFVRFRSPIPDPRDAALYFLGIGLGMACGLGLFAVAGVSLALLLVIVAVLDRFAGKPREEREDLELAEMLREE